MSGITRLQDNEHYANYNIDSKKFIRQPIFSCHLDQENTGHVKVLADTFQRGHTPSIYRICLQNGTVENGPNSKISVKLEIDDSFLIPVEVCRATNS